MQRQERMDAEKSQVPLAMTFLHFYDPSVELIFPDISLHSFPFSTEIASKSSKKLP